ncbi:TonB-dependent siderophore receptor [Nitratireductor sp. ZSWI3]|uniref:TonB-dependent siderophore receptor n=1 Tax=Nitratireductor sp. ZSWI3 TaxID=2966359 RepID=UPI00214FAEA2|nr:TonB-dependent siderophore receptor [Nitratireductor sp. ZSWI3]MCR4268929.1 TonB-dependent siderophore receptor [Nitratireductor sp. ZSWI3]
MQHFDTHLPATGNRRAILRRGLLVGGSAATAIALLAGAIPATAQSATTTRLERLEVSDQSSDAGRADDNTVVAKAAASALKSSTPLAETPRSVSVITRKEIEERAVQDIIQAVRYSSGVVTGGYGYDPRFDQIYVRGFALTTTGAFRDGLRQPYMNYGMFRDDPYSLERIEVVKGPVSMLFGGGSPGGIVNKVSKMADGERHREVELQYGTVDRYQAAFDFSDALDEQKTLFYRLVGIARAADTNFDLHDDRLSIQPSLMWQPDADTSLVLYGQAQKDKTSASAAALNRFGVPLDMLASDPVYDHQYVEQYQLGYRFEHRFDNDVKLSQHVRWSYLDLDARYLSSYVTDGSGGWVGDVYRRGGNAVTDRMNVFQADTRLARDFDTGPLRHKVQVGLDYTDVRSSFGFGKDDTANPDYDLDLNNPVYGVDGPTPAITDRSSADLRQIGVYAFDEIELGRWRFTLGGRHDWADQTNTNDVTGVVTADKSNSAFSGQLGVLYRFDNGFAPYASYATSFLPLSEKDAAGAVLDPETAEQIEVGFKYQPDGAPFSVSAAAYQIIQHDKPEYVGFNGTTGSYIYAPLGEVTTRGFEVEARASLSSGFDVVAAYSYNDAEITGSSNAAIIGNTPAITPRHVASLWAHYTFDENSPLAGLALGAGVRHLSKSYTSSANTATNRAATYLDAAVSYDFGKARPDWDGLSLTVSATNLTDNRPASCESGYCYLAQGRSVVGALKYKW